jgi:phosphatidylglycerophosphate synthase
VVDDMTAPRRPLASRQARWARVLAARLAQRGVRPNAISLASVAFAMAGAGLLAASPALPGAWAAAACFLAAASVQARLLCNLLDGMVAVEGGRGTPDGAFWNEAPDRLSDLFLLAGAGVAAGSPALGLLAGAMAVATAWLREFGRAEGLGADFGGPMAKPQRMAVLTGAALLAAVAPFGLTAAGILAAALWVIVLGAALTAGLRARRLLAALRRASKAASPAPR